ncbi:glutamyl-tRNA reductase [Oxobacter pfennigii]|uniref:Glutamyl-tRNA reductase n=1 Tax=Oxobacter pfennigii TaxID=36849 RepID=A0A0P8YV80_9CLOT|nr:glutamyl-tRNA reductase [Oxobacter pfennigii]KPU43612.1 glutamyl-tRNA reductase [Oxobacter pfennigii]
MIQLIGVNDEDVCIREKLSIIPKHLEDALKKAAELCGEAAIISTCNRTEVYFNSTRTGDGIIECIFNCLGWDKELIKYTIYKCGDEAVRHLIEVTCGVHSRILGEEQILGQVKDAYDLALKNKTIKGELDRLFHTAITCGKEFRHKSELDKIPVSSASMVIREARKRSLKRFMVLGYGEVGSLACKYILEEPFDVLYIAVRDTSVVDIKDRRVKVIPFRERKEYYPDVECIISCTSAPHTVINSNELPNRKLMIFDMAVPRDVDWDVNGINGNEVYDIDMISALFDESLEKRRKILENFRHLIEKHIQEFEKWQNLKKLSPYIKRMKENGEQIYKQRSTAFRNKRHTKDNENLADILIKSTADVYVNRAIEVLKEEYLEGRGEECLKIIEKIFLIKC